jgi:polyisoprenoid-binding protein YceI
MKVISIRILVGLALIFSLASCGNSSDAVNENDEAGNDLKEVVYAIDSSSSEIIWSGTMLGMYSHSGTLKVKSGSVIMVGDKVTGGDIIVDMTSIFPNDGNYSEEKTKAMLAKHLGSADFFDVEGFPEASFKMFSAEKGELTIKGESEVIGLSEYDKTKGDGTIALKGEFTFDRKHFAVAFEHPLKENVISDEIQCIFKINGAIEGL